MIKMETHLLKLRNIVWKEIGKVNKQVIGDIRDIMSNMAIKLSILPFMSTSFENSSIQLRQ